ncbi:MAG: mechanosensitive ion channel family protein [Candidatus Omnitrophica bacterium]|nr:mechanosensitive ion channel family protein [Candidatus Omnitrophota bacterium]
MTEWLAVLPESVFKLGWSLVILLSAVLVGRLLARNLGRRLALWAQQTHWKWDEVVITALRGGVPFWAFLGGVYVVSSLWALPPQVFNALQRLLYVLTWFSITWIAATTTSQLVLLYSRQFRSALPVTSLTQNITRIVIVLLGILMILNGLGISVTPILTALGVGGLAVALALQDTLSNLFSGFYLTVARQVRIGDYIRLDSSEEGYVDDIGWRTTAIRMLPNNLILVPNNKLAQAVITNYDMPSSDLAVLVEANTGYGSDLERVEQVTCEVAKEVMRTVPGGIADFEPFIRYPSSITKCNTWRS